MSDGTLREPTFLILTALAAGAQHGYGIMTDVHQISGGRVKLRAGTLYAALDRLSAEGMVEPDRDESQSTCCGAPRRSGSAWPWPAPPIQAGATRWPSSA